MGNSPWTVSGPLKKTLRQLGRCECTTRYHRSSAFGSVAEFSGGKLCSLNPGPNLLECSVPGS